MDEHTPNTDKDLRIIRLQPWIKNGWIRFKPEHRELKRQLLYYRPKGRGGHDDGPDCLEMLLGLCEEGLHGAAVAAVKDEDRAENYHAPRGGRLFGALLGHLRRAA